MKKFLKIAAIVLVICVLLIGADWFPFKIITYLNKEMPAILWTKDGIEDNPKTIRIDGKLINRLWRNKVLDGTIEIVGHDYDKKIDPKVGLFLGFKPKIMLYSGWFHYDNFGVSILQDMGEFYTNETFSKIYIQLPNEGEELKIYVAPANNYAEANSLVQKYLAEIYNIKP